jgi:uncharacterized protein (DUF608 family)
MNGCGPNCDCKRDVSRRDLLRAGASVAGLLSGAGMSTQVATGAPGDIPPAARQRPPQAWFEALLQETEPIVYSGEQLKNLIFPLGGIGTGTVWLHGSGRLVNWQVFNNIQKDTQVDDTFLAVRIEQPGKPPIVRVLQQPPVGLFAGIQDLRFNGEYPVATLRFHDPEINGELELIAFNPLIPLDEKSSAMPCAFFTVRFTNRADQAVRVSVLASCQNAVGHSGQGAARGVSHSTYGGNVNRAVREDGFTAISMSAEPGKPAVISPPVQLLVDHQDLPLLVEPPISGLTLAGVGAPKGNPGARHLYWLANGQLRQLGGSILAEIPTAVREEGAFLLLSGVANPLLHKVRATVPAGERRRETVFASFDGSHFAGWEQEGSAFKSPKAGSVLGQHPVGGYLGGGLVNTFDPDDGPQGVLTSPPFIIHERYIAFLVGGGQKPGSCCVNLKVDGKTVRTVTGKNTEQLERVEWDVADLVNQEAHIELVDRSSDGWGHLLVDDIRFGNLPIDAITIQEADAWNNLLADAEQAGAMNPVDVGKGRVMMVPVELGSPRAGVDAATQRDRVLRLVASLTGVSYQPAIGRPANAPSAGTMCLATADPQATFRTGWTDRDELFRQFSETGRLGGGTSAALIDRAGPSPAGETVNAALCVESTAQPGASAEATFVAAWHFPHQYYPQNSWQQFGKDIPEVGNMYANWYRDASTVARQALANLSRLRAGTFMYREALFDTTTLPRFLVDAAAANVSILRSPTCFWTKADTFYGFEGCNWTGGGCCPMNCNHVWNYEQTLAKLWPALERNMRVTELDHHQQKNGGIHHRVEVPRDHPRKQHIPVADGQCGAVLKAYREHMQSSGRRFLDEHWPMVKKAMDFAIQEWDADGDGVMDKPQFNTYDRVIYGQNTFVSSLYLAALRAAEEMAKFSRDEEAAKRYRELFESGSRKIAETLFDGEYYLQEADNFNLGYGPGCWSDQVVGQWWARVLNLGDILPNEQVQSALKAIFKYNFLWTQEGFQGTQRFQQFADGKDKGLLCGSWPKGGRPEDPILYRDEIWTGVEYQVAAHKIYEGQVLEGLAIVKAARERYDGVKKSPWNEIECGDYYARAMSSWSLLLAAQGYAYDGPARSITFRPRIGAEQHRSLFTAAEGWGRFEHHRKRKQQTNSLSLLAGRLDLAVLRFALPANVSSAEVRLRLENQNLVATAAVESGDAFIRLSSPVTLAAGETLHVNIDWD